MARNNNQTNQLIMWLAIAGDFVMLNAVLYGFFKTYGTMDTWSWENKRLFLMICNTALLMGEIKFHTRIHERIVSAGDVVRRVVSLALVLAIVSYVFMRHMMFWTGAGWLMTYIATVYTVVLLLARLLERTLVKYYRSMGRNTRNVTFIGSDPELWKLYDELVSDPTTGFRIMGYYADERNAEKASVPHLGTVAQLMNVIEQGGDVALGDEVYVCLSRRDRKTIRHISHYCDSRVVRFYFVPVSVESLSLSMKPEFINDIEVYTTYESPLKNPVNRTLKRIFDILVSTVALICTGVLFPFIYIIIKVQSPGPVFFKQLRTGLDGRDFLCYKFRSMHVNKDADKLQATKDDPRKYPFGNFMRKANIDELPQFWNVLKGDMSIVGPRPHMLAHTEMYSHLISQYMVRHFVKPGVTGWAQVTGFRGETKELWQMEERVKRDIWYMEHWTIWLDIRIVWMTFKAIFVHDENAY
ncbi:MAG: undecaprenyl-phosphate glucose phosphotransferase [Prevotella sp.]|nr:undecaprenyl-phosphate glucose phosphotransferase [Prevotella sp.]